ncbi:MAG: hypothetical protein QXG00_06825 [Candidatus Woesearchaeota archaeon]
MSKRIDDSELESLYLTEENQRELLELSQNPWKLFIENMKSDWYFFCHTGTAAKLKMRFNQFLYLIGIKKEWVTEKDYPEINWDITK